MAQRYEIEFTDRKGRDLRVGIFSSGWTGGVTRLTGGEAPLILQEDDSDGLDTPLRAWTGNLTVADVDAADLSGLFAADVVSARVELTDVATRELLWQGFITPEVMRQPWVSGEEVTVNVQSPLGALSGLTLDPEGGFGFTTLGALLDEVNALAGGAWDYVAYPDDISLTEGGDTSAWLDLQVSRYAFFDTSAEEEEVTPDVSADVLTYTGASGSAVVEAVARLMGWTASERGRTLWFTAESAPGYRRVSAAQLSQAGRRTEALEDAQIALYSLTPAGTDHTDSLLQGYRRVEVQIEDGEVSSLLADELDASNWTPLENYNFEGGYPARVQTVEGNWDDVGTFVCTSDNLDINDGAGGVYGTRRGIRYDVAAYAAESVSGESRTHLYRATHSKGTTWRPQDDSYVIALTELTRPEDLDGLDYEKNWGYYDESGVVYDAISTVGARRARLTIRNALLTSDTTYDGFVRAHSLKSRQSFDGFVLWPCIRRDYPVSGGSASYFGTPLIRLHDPRCVLLSGVALRLTARFCGFWGQPDAPDTDQIPAVQMGPFSIAGPGVLSGVTNAVWPVMLRVGDYYWTASGNTPGAWTKAGGEGYSLQAPLTTTDAYTETSTEIDKLDDVNLYDSYELESGYVIPLTGPDGEALSLSGDVELCFYLPNINGHRINSTSDDPYQVNFFNPMFIYDIGLEVLTPDTSAGFETHRSTTFTERTGAKFAGDVKSVTLALSTTCGAATAYGLLLTPGGEPLSTLVSKRQGGRAARPERLVLGLLKRLYGRARRQLCVEVDAARLSPSATVTDGPTRYALSGVEWDVRESSCKYTLEDYVPYDEWKN